MFLSNLPNKVSTHSYQHLCFWGAVNNVVEVCNTDFNFCVTVPCIWNPEVPPEDFQDVGDVFRCTVGAVVMLHLVYYVPPSDWLIVAWPIHSPLQGSMEPSVYEFSIGRLDFLSPQVPSTESELQVTFFLSDVGSLSSFLSIHGCFFLFLSLSFPFFLFLSLSFPFFPFLSLSFPFFLLFLLAD